MWGRNRANPDGCRGVRGYDREVNFFTQRFVEVHHEEFTVFREIAALSVATLFAITQPAKAVLVNTFSFDDLGGFGTGRVPGGTVTGTITFNSLNPGDSATGVAADSLVVDSIPSWIDSTWGDAGGMSTGINITSLTGDDLNLNFFDVTNGTIDSSTFIVRYVDNEFIGLVSNNFSEIGDFSPALSYVFDQNSTSLTFSGQSAAVPFEFSPTLGLLMLGGAFGVSRYAKRRKAASLIEK